MKKIFITLSVVVLCCGLFTSCEEMFGDFLEKAPGVEGTEDTMFGSVKELESFIVGMYAMGAFGEFEESSGDPRYLGAGGNNGALYDWATDAGKPPAAWYWPNNWHRGDLNPQSNLDNLRNMRYAAIRIANIILERVDEVPAEQSYIDQVRGEALVIRAYNHFNTFRIYGGIPLVDKRLTVADNYYIPRSSVEETVNFIVDDCNKAAELLPDAYPSNFFGRVTKGAALALKARVLLYAASPLFNTATPYLDLPGHNDLLCYGNYDQNRWQIAADAAKAVLDWAPSGGISLINDKGIDKNYRAIWEEYANVESIWNSSAKVRVGRGSPPWRPANPAVILNGLSGNTVPLNFIKLYRKKDGTEQTWDMSGGNNLNEIYANMEERFQQTFDYNLSYRNPDYPLIELWQADPENNISEGKHTSACVYGIWARKPVPVALRSSGGVRPMENLFRLGEIYLYYAEALNEAQGPVDAAYDAIDNIRNRSGLPNLQRGLTQEQFREEVRREFSIEMIYEVGHRFWNLRRWLMAEQKMKGEMWGIKIYRIPGTNPAEYRYEPYVVENRNFYTRFYLNPWDQNEVNKGHIIQNPGY